MYGGGGHNGDATCTLYSGAFKEKNRSFVSTIMKLGRFIKKCILFDIK